MPSPTRNYSRDAVTVRCCYFAKTGSLHGGQIRDKLCRGTLEANDLDEKCATSGRLSDSHHGVEEACEVCLIRLSAAAHRVMRRSPPILQSGDPEGSRCFTTATDLPSVVEDMHAWIGRTGNDQVGGLAVTERGVVQEVLRGVCDEYRRNARPAR